MPKIDLKLVSQTANEKAAGQAAFLVANLIKEVEDLQSKLATTTDEHAAAISKMIDGYNKQLARRSRLIDELEIKERKSDEVTASLMNQRDELGRDNEDAKAMIISLVKKTKMLKEELTRKKKADETNALAQTNAGEVSNILIQSTLISVSLLQLTCFSWLHRMF